VTDGETPEDQIQNAKYAISIARKLGATIFVLPEDIVDVKPKMLLTFFGSVMAVALGSVEERKARLLKLQAEKLAKEKAAKDKVEREALMKQERQAQLAAQQEEKERKTAALRAICSKGGPAAKIHEEPEDEDYEYVDGDEEGEEEAEEEAPKKGAKSKTKEAAADDEEYEYEYEE